jgi:hypothetical protein
MSAKKQVTPETEKMDSGLRRNDGENGGNGQSGPPAYTVITNRRPFWGGKARPEGYVIRDPEADPNAVMRMRGRGWIREVPREPAA